MSGPDEDFSIAGGDGIGSFAIGISEIGKRPAFDPWDTIISQYANSPIITGLILKWWACINQTRNIDKFYSLIRNLDSAKGYGLDVWGRIVGVNRVIKLGVGPRYFGYEEGLPDYDPFDVSPLYSGQKLTENFALSDDGFKTLILAKAFANISDGSIQSINALLQMLFGPRRCYVTDLGGMEMTYTFEFPLSPVQLAILEQSGVMPRPVGVSVTIVQL